MVRMNHETQRSVDASSGVLWQTPGLVHDHELSADLTPELLGQGVEGKNAISAFPEGKHVTRRGTGYFIGLLL